MANSRRKLALVIGNEEYENGCPGNYSGNDAKDMCVALESIGFNTGGPRLNLTVRNMSVEISNFMYDIQAGDIVLFYFSGVAFEWKNHNYLIPKDNDGITEDNIRKRGISAEDILDRFNDQEPYVTVFLLDCCRVSPRKEDTRGHELGNNQISGLRAINARAGCLIAFACTPGTVTVDRNGEKNSLFTKHLLKHITTPNKDISNILRCVAAAVVEESGSHQIPFQSISLIKENVFLNEQPISEPKIHKPKYTRKVALIIGNGKYKYINPLKNPKHDANELSLLLKRIKFDEVVLAIDTDSDRMNNAIRDFQRKIQSDDLVCFFFAGHGIQWEDQNYLMPIDIPDINDINSMFKEEKNAEKRERKIAEKKTMILADYGINAQCVLRSLSAHKPYATIFLLDCCRNYILRNPTLEKIQARSVVTSDSKGTGIKAMHQAGSLIAFACAPGCIADDTSDEKCSRFTKHLLKHMCKPNEDIVNLLRDVTDGVMEESGNEQIPFLSVQLRHRNICLYE